mmetsp:Transcript_8044/g.9881  ORF Transcript_8044/g.9881 Transcript_8044/m.9881 type:complete len:245 (+) Transcript_8044:69-803(+)
MMAVFCFNVAVFISFNFSFQFSVRDNSWEENIMSLQISPDIFQRIRFFSSTSGMQRFCCRFSSQALKDGVKIKCLKIGLRQSSCFVACIAGYCASHIFTMLAHALAKSLTHPLCDTSGVKYLFSCCSVNCGVCFKNCTNCCFEKLCHFIFRLSNWRHKLRGIILLLLEKWRRFSLFSDVQTVWGLIAANQKTYFFSQFVFEMKRLGIRIVLFSGIKQRRIRRIRMNCAIVIDVVNRFANEYIVY